MAGSTGRRLEKGKVPALNCLYVAIKDFNPEDKEVATDTKHPAIKILSFRTGELVLITKEPNRGGWFEGYRHNDPERLCGISHISTLNKVNFK